MRILHVAETARGGVGAYLSYVVPAQAAAPDVESVRVVAPAQHRAALERLNDSQVRGYDRPDRSVESLRRLAAALLAEVATFRPDLVHAHSTFAGLVVRALFGARVRRPRLVYCPHGWAFDIEAPLWRRSAVAGLESVLAAACDTVVAISDHEAAQGRRIGISARRLRLIVSGVPDAAPAAPAVWRDERRKVLFVGRLDRQKGADVLCQAVSTAADQLAVRLVGAEVADGVALSYPPNVERLGWLEQDRVARQVAAADVIAIPSRWEGFGLVAAEAMRASKPVVASCVGGLTELVSPGSTGALVRPGDPDALRQALLAQSGEELVRMGTRGRLRYVERFTAARMNAELLALYQDLLRPKVERGRRSHSDPCAPLGADRIGASGAFATTQRIARRRTEGA